MAASYIGHLDVVKTLIKAGANVNHTNKVGTCICTLLLYTYTVLLYCLSSASLCTC